MNKIKHKIIREFAPYNSYYLFVDKETGVIFTDAVAKTSIKLRARGHSWLRKLREKANQIFDADQATGKTLTQKDLDNFHNEVNSNYIALTVADLQVAIKDYISNKENNNNSESSNKKIYELHNTLENMKNMINEYAATLGDLHDRTHSYLLSLNTPEAKELADKLESMVDGSNSGTT